MRELNETEILTAKRQIQAMAKAAKAAQATAEARKKRQDGLHRRPGAA